MHPNVTNKGNPGIPELVSNDYYACKKRVCTTKFSYFRRYASKFSLYILKQFTKVKVGQRQNNFFKPIFSPKTNEQILLYYYKTSGRLVFLEEIEGTKKTFRN